MKKLLSGVAGASIYGLAMASVPAVGEEIDRTTAAFAALPSVEDVSISPTGRWLAVIEPLPGGGQTLAVGDLEAAEISLTPIQSTRDRDNRIDWCDWADEAQLICNVRIQTQIEGVPVYASRLFAINRDGSKFRVLTAPTNNRSLGYLQSGGSIVSWSVEGAEGAIAITRDFVPERTTNTRLASEEDGLGVELVDLGRMTRRTIEKARVEATGYIADERGKVRIVRERDQSNTGYLEDRVRYLYRPRGGGAWRKLEVTGDFDGSFRPVAVDGSENRAYGFATKDGFTALYSVVLDGSSQAQVVLARKDADVDRLLRLGHGGRIVGASYATERRLTEIFDPQVEALRSALGNALPDHPDIDVIDASADESRLLLIASSDTDPGMVYLYDREAQSLEPILPLREGVAEIAMGRMTPVSFPASDGTRIPAYLTLPPTGPKKGLPAIVMPHGGPSARDEWGFDWMVQFFVSQGYAVLQPNYRGSSGYGTDWFGRNGFQAWDTAIGDVNDAGRWLVAEGIARPGSLAIFGWSYGGYAALQSQVLAPDLYKAVVAIAPVTDLELLRDEARPYTNFKLVDDFIGHGPHIDAGSPARHADAFRSPVLIFHGSQDKNVAMTHARKMQRELRQAGKRSELVEYEGLDHYLEDSRTRYDMLMRTKTFLRGALAD